VLIVGRAAGLRDHLRWFDERPLFGKRVLVTRPREQAGELIELLEDLGAEAIEAPSIRIAPPIDFAPLDHACAQAGTYDWIVFTTATSVDWVIGRLLAGRHDVRALSGPKICTIGPATADRLTRVGIKADLEPVEFRAEAIIEAMRAENRVAGSRVLLPRADGAREIIAEELRKAGAEVTEVTAYRALPVQTDPEHDIYRMLLEGQIDIVMFTSASTVRGFVGMLGEDQAIDLLRSTVVACIGPVTAEAAQRLGIHPAILPKTYTISALVHAVVDYYGTQEPEPASRKALSRLAAGG
jgi:uroporphyrinogen III methyltransferase/synthase